MLTNNELILRAPEPGDIDFIFKLENDQQFWHLSNTLVPFSRFDIEQYVFLADKDIYSARQVRFIIETKVDSSRKPVGAIDLFDFEPMHLRAGVGIMVVDNERKKGIAGQALERLIEYAFKTLGLHQLYANIEEDNELSLRLFRKKGFEDVGLKKEWNKRNGRWINEHLLQMINKGI